MRSFIFLVLLLFGFIRLSLAQENCNCDSFTEKVRIEFDRYINSGRFEEASIIAARQIKTNNPCCQAIGYTLEAWILNGKGNPRESLASAFKAQKILHKNFNVFASAESNRVIGYYYHKQGNADSAILFYLKGLEEATAAEDYYLVSRSSGNIAVLYSNRKQEQKGLVYQKKAVDAALLSKDTGTIAEAYTKLVTSYGRVYDDTEKEIYVDSAELVAQTAIKYAKATGNKGLIIRNYLSVEKFAIVRKQFTKALMYSDTLRLLIDDKTSLLNRISFSIDRGVVLTGLKKYDEAIQYMNTAYELVKQTGNVYQERMMNDRLYEVYKAKDDPKKALAYLERFRVLNDSLIDKENSNAINEFEVKYNKLQDQQTIKDLAQQKQTYLLLSLAGLLGVIAIAVFLRQQSLRHKKNILETEQRLNRARMNPHFFFNALTALQKFALKENNGPAMASNLSKFSNIMRETLESTYKEYVTVEQEMEFLTEYLEVQRMRFPQTFSYEVSAAASMDIDEMLIPSMIIQPFIENSIEHGFAGIDYPGNIKVTFAKADKEMLIEIKDNGKGLVTVAKENNEHISRASQIIKDRIYLLNIKLKTKAGFSIDNDASGKGVIVKIHLPLLYKTQTHS
jgi:sensor histidine kinase YesM